MNHYNIALLNSPLEPLTYQSNSYIAIGTKVTVPMRSKEVEGVVLGVCDKPSFDCLEILESSGFCYSPKQLEIATFMALAKLILSALPWLLMTTPFNPTNIAPL